MDNLPLRHTGLFSFPTQILSSSSTISRVARSPGRGGGPLLSGSLPYADLLPSWGGGGTQKEKEEAPEMSVLHKK